MESFIEDAIGKSRQAYEFSANSYTNAVFHAVMAVEEEFLRQVPQGHRECG
jgi:hypothetical protein